MLYPVSNQTASAEYFVSLQGGGRRRCGGIVDWRQRGRWQNMRCWKFDYWPDGALVLVCNVPGLRVAYSQRLCCFFRFCLFLHASSLSLYLVIRGTATKSLIASHIRITTLSYGWVYSINGFFCQIGRWIKESSDLSQEEIWRRSCLLYWMYRDVP